MTLLTFTFFLLRSQHYQDVTFKAMKRCDRAVKNFLCSLGTDFYQDSFLKLISWYNKCPEAESASKCDVVAEQTRSLQNISSFKKKKIVFAAVVSLLALISECVQQSNLFPFEYERYIENLKTYLHIMKYELAQMANSESMDRF
ncbi:hypothetical protein AVEN_20214-1 [Araneus ventricosus]|uniref:Uncharacterized protein n=1 Tax=Araneus ventricosus TaxID=182803 RepID=A0A4Y2CN91_ARAVE|nr:hypothetical protein AVEN_20214-1 [Araneus ventricosus]